MAVPVRIQVHVPLLQGDIDTCCSVGRQADGCSLPGMWPGLWQGQKWSWVTLKTRSWKAMLPPCSQSQGSHLGSLQSACDVKPCSSEATTPGGLQTGESCPRSPHCSSPSSETRDEQALHMTPTLASDLPQTMPNGRDKLSLPNSTQVAERWPE